MDSPRATYYLITLMTRLWIYHSMDILHGIFSILLYEGFKPLVHPSKRGRLGSCIIFSLWEVRYTRYRPLISNLNLYLEIASSIF